MDGWMGIYWEQLARAFEEKGAVCRTLDYRRADGRAFFRRIFPGDSETILRRRRTRALISATKEHRPDILLLHSMRFDLYTLREAFEGSIVYWDIDGPAGPLGRGALPSMEGMDLLLTVSRVVLRKLEKEADLPARYLPHGADLDFYKPGPLSPALEKRFASPLAFVGRPTERRARFLEPLAGEGLVVWGSRWGKRPWSGRAFHACRREGGNIEGEEVVALYRAAGVVLNVSREPFADPPTTMNLQVFHVPAAGGCLLTERVEELEEAFEPDREVLTFQGPEAFVEKAQRYGRDRDACRRIGEAGRRRCEAEHSLHARAGRIIEYLKDVKG